MFLDIHNFLSNSIDLIFHNNHKPDVFKPSGGNWS